MSTATLPVSNLLTRQQAAEFLGLRPQTLACWASTGRHGLSYVKAGRSVRYRLSDLQNWMESRVRTSTST